MMDPVKAIFVLFAATAFSLSVIFGGLSNVGRLDKLERNNKLFPNAFGSTKEQILIEPVSSIYAVWVFNYLYQFGFICYAISLIFRQGAPDVLNKKFYGSYVFAMIFNVIWMFIWTHHLHALGFVFYILSAIFLNLCLYFACSGCVQYLQSFPTADSNPSTPDIWALRFLVLNGMSFLTGWLSATGLVNLAVVLQADLEVSAVAASKVSLSLMLVGIVLWALVQNSPGELHTRFMFAEYVAVLVVLGGVIAKKWHHQHEEIRSFALALFIISLMLMIFRLGMIITREMQRGVLQCGRHEPGENVKLV